MCLQKCELEEHHGAQLGQGYKNDRAVPCLSSILLVNSKKSLRLPFQGHIFLVSKLIKVLMLETLTTSSFLSFSLTPVLAMVLYMFGIGFSVRQLKCATAVGVFECFKAAIEYVGVSDLTNKMIAMVQIPTSEREQE